jgi:acetone carboxylase alpha subunit
MTNVHEPAVDSVELTPAQQVAEFLSSTVLFRGPDPDIIRNHRMLPRTPAEERALRGDVDPMTRMVVRNRVDTIATEARDLLQHIASAPPAKWGDMVTAVFTASGDLAMASSTGLTVFSLVAHYPIKYINRHWAHSETVGVRDGDLFTHNDSRFGNIHQPDQSMFTPIFQGGELICWAGTIVHEGENGAREPGGMPVTSESPYDEGLRLSPLKVGENLRLRDDIVTYLQNSVRDPKLQVADMRARVATVVRMRQRLLDIADRYGADVLIGTLRGTLEDTAREVRRRVRALPDATIRVARFTDSTLREPALVKTCCELTVRDDTVTIDLRGSAPQIGNRALNAIIATTKGLLAHAFYGFMWPDLPRNQAVMDCIEFITDENSILDASGDVPNALCITNLFHAFVGVNHCLQKLLFNNLHNGNPAVTTELVSDWWGEINTFVYGGITQHGAFSANLLGELNAAPGGARRDRDGEHSMAPNMIPMADSGEVEVLEDEVPVIELASRRLLCDNHGPGQYRGGSGVQQIVTYANSPMMAFGAQWTGSRFPYLHGLFGGYGSPVYPLLKVTGVDALSELARSGQGRDLDLVRIMNERPFEGAQYTSHSGTYSLAPAAPGELWLTSQGGGGGYADVLDRDPEAVVADLAAGVISEWAAAELYQIRWDPGTMRVLPKETADARNAVRRERLAQAEPFEAFEARWISLAPPDDLPFFGSWGDRAKLYAGGGRAPMEAGAIEPILLPPPGR